ncbi:DUF3558 domain-containing protein [Mycobacterium sp. NPDC050041]|uniref:DUF3558 domain-containing protein n=1 Tax=Mycobacterium sp. NPDC050041 TaxID=3364293 RepID=UPI003C2CBE03
MKPISELWAVPAVIAVLGAAVLTGCGAEEQSEPPAAPPTSVDGGFRGGACNGVTDADVTEATGASLFTKVVEGDAGCFWQENSLIGTFGAGMGISTWWYRGSDMDIERTLEQRAGRTLTELTLDGNKGFRAADDNACSIYVAKGRDVITWSIQTMNPATLPDLCEITERLAELSQQRVN